MSSTTALQAVLGRDGLGQFLEDVRPAFARHETFHPRFGWLKKGFDAALKLPDVFLHDDATIRLGVGKNMVRAIRYWCSAFKILEERPSSERPRLREAHPTVFGDQLLGPGGWDPYLERPASLWLLHWKLLEPPCVAPSCFATFNVFRGVEFSDSELLQELIHFRDTHGWSGIVDSSINKDVRCILRMYAGGRDGRATFEESLDSPFMELDLIRHTTGAASEYRFNLGEKYTLPDDILVFACLEFAGRLGPDVSGITVRRLAYQSGGPGCAFKLTESALTAGLERSLANIPEVQLTEASGAVRVSFSQDPRILAAQTLSRFYDRPEGRR